VLLVILNRFDRLVKFRVDTGPLKKFNGRIIELLFSIITTDSITFKHLEKICKTNQSKVKESLKKNRMVPLLTIETKET
jgi:hypothetical protein